MKFEDINIWHKIHLSEVWQLSFGKCSICSSDYLIFKMAIGRYTWKDVTGFQQGAQDRSSNIPMTDFHKKCSYIAGGCHRGQIPL